MTNKIALTGLLAIISIAMTTGFAYADDHELDDIYIFHATGTIEIPAGTTMNDGKITVNATQSPASLHLKVVETSEGVYEFMRGMLNTIVYLDTHEVPQEKRIIFDDTTSTFTIVNGTVSIDGESKVTKKVKAQRIIDLDGEFAGANDGGRDYYDILGTIDVSDTSRGINMTGSFIAVEDILHPKDRQNKE